MHFSHTNMYGFFKLIKSIYIYIYIYRESERTSVMQLGSMFISKCNNNLHVSDAFCVHPQEDLKTVVTASGV